MVVCGGREQFVTILEKKSEEIFRGGHMVFRSLTTLAFGSSADGDRCLCGSENGTDCGLCYKYSYLNASGLGGANSVFDGLHQVLGVQDQLLHGFFVFIGAWKFGKLNVEKDCWTPQKLIVILFEICKLY